MTGVGGAIANLNGVGTNTTFRGATYFDQEAGSGPLTFASREIVPSDSEYSYAAEKGSMVMVQDAVPFVKTSTNDTGWERVSLMSDVTNVVNALASTNSGLNVSQVDAHIASSNLVSWPYNQQWAVQTTSSNITLGLVYNFTLADTDGGVVTLILPTNAPIGWSCTVANVGGFSLIVEALAGHTIDGSTNLTIATENSTRGLMYWGSKWKIYQ
jgi:hypothetical protein